MAPDLKVEYRSVNCNTIEELNELGTKRWLPHSLSKDPSPRNPFLYGDVDKAFKEMDKEMLNPSPQTWSGLVYRTVPINSFQK